MDKEKIELLQDVLVFCAIIYIYIVLKAIYNSRRYFIIEEGSLKYFVGKKLKYDLPLEETKLSYRFTYHRRHYDFYLLIKHNNKIKKINCSHLDYQAFYIDLMKLQGRNFDKFVLDSKYKTV